MKERVFFESEVFVDCLTDACNQIALDCSAGDILDEIDVSAADALNDALHECLIANIDSMEHADCTIDAASSKESEEGFGLRFRTAKRNGKPVMMRFYRISTSWKGTAFSLTGLALALYASPKSAILPSARLASLIYENLITLRSPEDDVAIHAYQGILRAKATARFLKKRTIYFPTLEEVHLETKNAKLETTSFGLNRLKDQDLIKIKEWGNQNGDYGHPQNRWTLRL